MSARPRSARHWRRRLPWLLAIAAVGLLGAWQAPRLFPAGGDAAASLQVPVTPALLARGESLARMGDCVACHSAPGGEPFAGGLPLASPIGVIYSTNITPDPDTGIGGYSLGDFERAVRRGVTPDGTPLYPAMPFPSYARVSDEDIAALYAYFRHGVAPVRQDNRRTGIPWPLSLRWPLAYWRALFAPTPAQALAHAPGYEDPVVARGAYLVEGLGHCGACHSPRALTLQEKALHDDPARRFLGGGSADGWVAPSLRGEALTGLGGVSEDDIVRFLGTGRTDTTAAFGGMADVVQHSTQYVGDDDLRAIARYLKTLAPAREEAPFVADPAVAQALRGGDASARGAQVYVDSCATCHRTHGGGYAQVYPALAGNPAVNGDDPSSLVRIVLNGAIMPSTRGAPTQFAMPGFGDRLSDAEIADVVSFIRGSWGNRGAAVGVAEVRRLRAKLPAQTPIQGVIDPRTAADLGAAVPADGTGEVPTATH
ncbi:cytochrome c [Luteimonas sp. BDR2-5]|uniref:cytochrome c n=1 Tax=Proluteimonas luteida TaxID=2878685 RepID=UPI001E5967DE|nr:c-type cytochrome [Luteimonas sp. BDR2-5]MCD9026890.1 cytochrome c [Luteimonas sp. BDR2-5]